MRGTFRFNDDYVYRMPVHFGGHPFYPVRTRYGDMTSLAVSYETEAEALLPFIPEVFELTEPLVKVQYANSRDVEWMAGGEYRLVQVSVPVRYLGREEEIPGDYVLVIWENKACPILGGREEDGMPKLFADIPCERHVGGRWHSAASYESHQFLSLTFEEERPLSEGEMAQWNQGGRINYFGWRHLPNVGRGGAALSHGVLYPQEMRARQILAGKGEVRWLRLTEEQHPLQWFIIDALAALPVKSYRPAVLMRGEARLNVGDSRVLS